MGTMCVHPGVLWGGVGWGGVGWGGVGWGGVVVSHRCFITEWSITGNFVPKFSFHKTIKISSREENLQQTLREHVDSHVMKEFEVPQDCQASTGKLHEYLVISFTWSYHIPG